MISERTALKHGDRVLFGNSNLFVVCEPEQPVSPAMTDYESLMHEMLKSQMEAFGQSEEQEKMKQELEEMKERIEREKAETEARLKKEQESMEAAKQRLEEELKTKEEEIKRQIEEEALKLNNDEVEGLQQELQRQ